VPRARPELWLGLLAFRKWHQRVADRTGPPPKDALRELDEARTAILDYMANKNAEAAATLPDTPTHEDRILQKLEPLLQGRVGPAPDVPTMESLRIEGKARIAAKVPPGYMDGEKDADRAIGDFLVWRQTMEASRDRGLPILLVTQDQKEDWWADRGTKSMRARPELVAEFLSFAGQRILMIRSHDLVRLGSHIGVDVSQSTLTEAEITYEDVDGWQLETVTAYLDLLEKWPEHFQILAEAVKEGGEIARPRMAEILRREPDAGMHGVGMPYVTVMRQLIKQGVLDAEPTAIPLSAYYATGGWMSHFVMPKYQEPLHPWQDPKFDGAVDSRTSRSRNHIGG
jgi:hypothetical protein